MRSVSSLRKRGSMGEILRIKHKKNYVILDKTYIEDVRLSWKAKGILTYLLSRPDNWEANESDIVKRSTDGKCSSRSGLKELEAYGYYRKIAVRDERGRFLYWESTVSEIPMDEIPTEVIECEIEFNPSRNECEIDSNLSCDELNGELSGGLEAESPVSVYPFSENRIVDNPIMENRTLINNNNIIINDSNNIYCASDDAPCSQNTFDVAWERYPRKRGKAKISKQQKKHLSDLGQELLRALERYKAELQTESWKQPQNGDTFFTRGYIDYLDKNYSPLPKPNAPSMPPPKNQFNNFTQRTYDYDELERLLLTTTV